VIAKGLEIRIPLEIRVAREAVVRGRLDPGNRLVQLPQRRICGRDVVRGVMKMAKSAAELDCPRDGLSRADLVAQLGQ